VTERRRFEEFVPKTSVARLSGKKRTSAEQIRMSAKCQSGNCERGSARKKCAPALIGDKLDWRAIKCLQLRALKNRISRPLIKPRAFTQ
jgi:hypothetical protein